MGRAGPLEGSALPLCPPAPRTIFFAVGSALERDALWEYDRKKSAGASLPGRLRLPDRRKSSPCRRARRLGKRALSPLTMSGHSFTGESLPAQERQDSFREILEIALETAWRSLG
jgi:hypothetical protein